MAIGDVYHTECLRCDVNRKFGKGHYICKHCMIWWWCVGVKKYQDRKRKEAKS
jgi:hypothetical protein